MQNDVVLFDVSNRTQVEVSGSDRSHFLHNLTSNNIKELKPGEGCETFLTNLKGKVVAHVYAFCGTNSIWLDGTPHQQSAIIGNLSKYVLIDDVQIADRSNEFGELYLTGPLAAQLLQLDDPLPLCSHVSRELDGESFNIRRVDLFGMSGFLMSTPLLRIESVKAGLRAVGVTLGTDEQFESLRIESGYPRFGVDFTDDYLAQEVARTKQCISFNKGCYLGQETIARLDALGHTNRELRRMEFDTSTVPEAATPVFDEEGVLVGNITSATRQTTAPPNVALPKVIAIGTLKRAALKPGHAVSININGALVTGRVV